MKEFIFFIVCVTLHWDWAVCGVLVNVALKKTAKQSSTESNEGKDLVPSLAVDGVKNQHVGSCSQTQRQNSAWWRVDLEEMYHIYKITIYSRNDSYSDRLSDFKISTSNNDINFVTCYWHNGVFPSVPTDVSCQTSWPKRYIKIKLDFMEALTLCEVEVYVEQEVESSSTNSDMTTVKGLSSELQHADESSGSDALPPFKDLTSTVKRIELTSQELKSYELKSQELKSQELTTLSASQWYQLAFQESFSPEPTSSQSYLRISQESLSPELTISQSNLLISHEPFSHDLTSRSDHLAYHEQLAKETTSLKDVLGEDLPTKLLSDELLSTANLPETLPYESSRRSSQGTGVNYLLTSNLLTDGFETTKLPTNPLSSNHRLMLPTFVLSTNTVFAPSKVNIEKTVSHLMLETKTEVAATLNLLTITDHLIGSCGSSMSHVFTYDIDTSSIEGNENFISLSSASFFDSKETNRPDHMSMQRYITSTLSSSVLLETTELLITPTKYEASLLCSRRCKEIVLSEQLQKYKDDLTLDKTSLSKYVRAKTSADNKTSVAKLIGWPGVVIFSVLVFLIILSDLPTLFCGHRRISRK